MGLFDAISGRNYRMNKIMKTLFSEKRNKLENLDSSEESEFVIFIFNFSYNLISELFNPKYNLFNHEIGKLNIDNVRELNRFIATWRVACYSRGNMKEAVKGFNQKKLFADLKIIFGIEMHDYDSLISVMDLLATDKNPPHLVNADYEQEIVLLGTQVLDCIKCKKSNFNPQLFRVIVLKTEVEALKQYGT